MKTIRKISVMFVFLVCFTMFGQNDATMQIVRTDGQVGFLLKTSEYDGFFKEVFTFTSKNDRERTVTKFEAENVEYKKHKVGLRVFTIWYVDSKSQIRKESYNLRHFKIKHQTGGFFSLRNDVLEVENIADVIERSYFVSSINSCSCSTGFLGSKCNVSCPEGYVPTCDCNSGGAKCYCESPRTSPSGILPSSIAIIEELIFEEEEKEVIMDSLLANDDTIEILVAPNPTNSEVGFYIQNSDLDRATYQLEIFDSYGTKIIGKQTLPEKIDLSKNRKGLYIYVIHGEDGYIQTGKIMRN